MTRYGIFAYLLVVAGLVLEGFYGIGHYAKAAYAYQIANHITPRLQEGSYWLITNTEPFIFPGVALIIIGMAMVFYDAKKRIAAHSLRSADVAKA